MSTLCLLAHETSGVKFLGFDIGFWGIIGFVAQAVFFSRFFFQWLASERRRHSYVPVYFWWISLAGGSLMLAYALGIRELPLIVGQGFGLLVHTRNLILIYGKRRLAQAAAVEPGDSLYVHSDSPAPDDAADRD